MNDGIKFDNEIARLIDPGAAASMESSGSDIKFIAPLEPAYHNRKADTWSRCVWEGARPKGTILAKTFEELVQRVEDFERFKAEGRLAEWRETVYLPQRAKIVFESGLMTNDRGSLLKYLGPKA